MTENEARNLESGDRVFWESSNERGTVTGVTDSRLYVQWDEEDVSESYPIKEQHHGVAHIQPMRKGTPQ